MKVSGSTTGLTITYNVTGSTAAPPDAVSLLQQISSTAYDAAGNVTAATDALNHATTYTYDSLGQETAVDQGQIIDTNAPGYTTPGSPPRPRGASRATSGTSTSMYELGRNPASGWQDYFGASGANLNTATAATTMSPGGGWCYLGSVTLASGNSFSVNEDPSGASCPAGSASCSKPRPRPTTPTGTR